jgi:hypothetical protein
MTQIEQMDADSDRICVHLLDLRHLRFAGVEYSMALWTGQWAPAREAPM